MHESDTVDDTEQSKALMNDDASETVDALAKKILRLTANLETLKQAMKDERALRNQIEQENESMRVAVNVLELEIQNFRSIDDEKEDEKYEDIEGAGEW